MTKNNKAETRTVPTTILTIDREAINWDLLKQQCHIVRYDIRQKDWGESNSKYYSRMHIWYKQASDFPCYLQTHASQLYVKYPSSNEVVELIYQKQEVPFSTINLQDENLLPWIMKLLVADFFQVDKRFVSNTHFFLRAQVHKNVVTGLNIDLNHNWRENNDEFVISDKAARLSKLRAIDFDEINDWRRKNLVYYGRFYVDDMLVFKQLKQNELTSTQMEEGIYKWYDGRVHDRASLQFHSVKSLQSLQQTRSFLLNQFICKFVTYLNSLGLPFQQKQVRMHKMHTTSTASMTKRQLPLEQKPIYVVDDRLSSESHPENFVPKFCEVANNAIDAPNLLFVEKAEENIQPGDWILRLQDYEKGDFDPKTGLLKDWQDPKTDFYARHPDIVKQSLNVNKNSDTRQTDIQKNRSRNWTTTSYLDYSLPKKNELKTKFEVCRNQLLLKDIILFPKNVRQKLPQVDLMTGMVFLYEQGLVHFDGNDLYFMSVANNIEAAISFVREHTGWDLIDDILLPSAKEWEYKGMAEEKNIKNATKRPFIMSRDFVWEIGEANGRPLYEDLILTERLETLEQPIPTKRFYPPQPIPENDHFTVIQLQDYSKFLDEYVHESTISYLDLKTRYGKHIKDERGNKLVENGGFFPLLGIHNDLKFKPYLSKCLGLTFESIREDKLFPVYKGIWYAPETNHYVVGVKDSNPGDQERGHVFRRIIVHQGEHDSKLLQTQLIESFFPLLEVNFIKYRNYTVMPFPFRLVTMWKETL